MRKGRKSTAQMGQAVWARRTILQRLAKLDEEVKRLQAHPDADSIHDTRVANRRVRAAARHLEKSLRPGFGERLRSEVDQGSQVFGELRDLDVLAESLTFEARRPHSPFPALLASFAKRRERVLQRIKPVAEALSRRVAWWTKRIENSEPVKPAGDDETVAEYFQRVYPKLLRRHFRRGKKLLRRDAGPEELHRFRIRTKRLRYITELYEDMSPALRPTLRDAIKTMRQFQDLLGRLQDQMIFINYFERRLMDVRTPQRQTEYIRVLHRARMRRQYFRGLFVARWRRLEQRDQEKKWLKEISNAAPPKPSKSS